MSDRAGGVLKGCLELEGENALGSGGRLSVAFCGPGRANGMAIECPTGLVEVALFISVLLLVIRIRQKVADRS